MCTVALAALPAGVPGQVLSFPARGDLVVFSATAVDGKGRPVTNLQRQDFRIFEEGRPQPISRFHGGEDLPARVLLLVDGSGSMNEELKMTSVRFAAERVLDALSEEDEVALAGFDSRYWGVVAFTRDRDAIRAGLASVEPFGSTALHDALDKAARDIATHGAGRRAVVVISDGVDTASERTPDEVLARSRALDVPIYAITAVSPLDDPESDLYVGRKRKSAALAGSEALERYATLSGGAAFRISTYAALREAAERISVELKHQYRLGYDPPAGPARFRRVEVRTTRKGVTVRTRSGYVPE
ncbi:MAG: VWA domain-containing protein [Acidobacteria bacterium]|jgi:VWFA-related protein|nr:VWA domain-containing protein [Acidobacteriota bacterium]